MKRRAGLLIGPLGFVAVLAAPPPAGLDPAGWRTAALAVLMATWWLTEALPLPATSLLPIALLPLVGAGSIREATSPYANPIIFLFLGGFLIAIAMERWALHRRIALAILARVGARPGSIVWGFMLATAFLSLWVSNSAVALMMLPIGLSVVGFVGPAGERSPQDAGAPPPDVTRPPPDVTRPPPDGFAVALMLGIAYAANIGGMGTLVGTPPNALLAGFLQTSYGIEIGFAQWMVLGIPLVLVALPTVFLVLTRRLVRLGPERPGARERILAERASLGSITRAECRVALVFALAAVLWVTRPLLDGWLPGLTDAGIAVGCGLLLFLVPSGEGTGRALLDWEAAERLPWGVLILFGGGLSLASAIDRTGLNTWLGGGAAGLSHWPVWMFVLAVTAVVVILTELTSNTATAAAFLPIVGAAALEMGWDPVLLAVPAALAASCAFMLPIATPPNAVVYGSGRVTVGQMARAGAWANVIMTLLITGFAIWLLPRVFGSPLP